MAAVLEIPHPEQLETRALSLPEQARAVVVRDQATYNHAAELLVSVAGMRREITEYHQPLKQKAHEAHRAICDAEAKMLAPIAEAERLLKSGIATYTAEQRRIEEERRRAAEAEARRKAEEEQLAAAIEAEQQGATHEEVAAVLAEPVIVPKVAPAPVFQRAVGISTQTRWSAEVTSMQLLCRAIADGKASPELVLPNQPALNRLAVALKGTLSIPGVRAVATETTVAAGRR